MHTLVLGDLRIDNFRNLRSLALQPAPRLNVIYGDNGAGKTSLLEAIYFVATSKSFRTSARRTLVNHGAETSGVTARFFEHGGALPVFSREQRATLHGNARSLRVDGNRPASAWEYASHSPVVAFHAAELALSAGPAAHRRVLLDRLAFFLDSVSADHRARYARALAGRQELLARSANEAELATFERLCALHGAELTRVRTAAADRLRGHFLDFLRRLSGVTLDVDLAFAPGGSADPDVAEERLQRDRARDTRRRQATFGPHRDDLAVSLGAHPARIVASQGQHRLITLALKAAEIAVVTEACRLCPILLLDDLSSELDASRTNALLAYFSTSPAQVFLTTTRPALMSAVALSASDRLDLRLEDGSIASPT